MSPDGRFCQAQSIPGVTSPGPLRSTSVKGWRFFFFSNGLAFYNHSIFTFIKIGTYSEILTFGTRQWWTGALGAA